VFNSEEFLNVNRNVSLIPLFLLKEQKLTLQAVRQT